MNILLSGASGFIGSALARHLLDQRHCVFPLKRSVGPPVSPPRWDPSAGTVELGDVPPLDAAVHLAGENIGRRRWTARQRERLWNSRVEGTRLLCQALSELQHPPRVLLSASAVGYYGDRGEQWLDEESPSGHGFLAELCRQWERATEPLQKRGVRVVHLRFGMVLDPAGGALARMLPLFRWGLGGRLGPGGQYWSWITRRDVVRAAGFLLEHGSVQGPVNLTSPQPVTNAEFTRALARVLRRPALLPVPCWLLRLAMGQMADETLLASVRVRPDRLLKAGFKFEDEALEPALRRLFEAENRVTKPSA